MTIELTPVGVACQLRCEYCYQNPQRDAGNVTVPHDFAKMKAGLEREGGEFSVFGGEPLLTPLPLLEEIFAYGYEKHGHNGIQTNGALITAAHLDLFRKYKVHVGFSLDGPDELNDSRWAGSLESTRQTTAVSLFNLLGVLDNGLSASVIVTLHRMNAVGERLDRLLQWFRTLEGAGVRDVRLHLLEVEATNCHDGLALTNEENTAALLRLYAFQATTTIQFDLFGEMARLLLGDDAGTTCIWNACDPYTTAAVRGVDAQGDSSNCGRTNKEGIAWQKAVTPGYERQVALYSTSQADNGCQDCRFFFACKGQCPGTAEHGDWRNRSEHCATWMALFAQIEHDLLALGRFPLSLDAVMREQVERLMVSYWDRGQNVSIARALTAVRTHTVPVLAPANQQHGDHWDAPHGYQHTDGPTTVHGDQGTTNMHGDSDA